MSLVHWMVADKAPSKHFAQALFQKAEINRLEGYASKIAHKKYREALSMLTIDELILLLKVCGEKLFTKPVYKGTPKRLASDPWTTPKHSP